MKPVFGLRSFQVPKFIMLVRNH